MPQPLTTGIPDPLQAALVDRYRIERRLGAGGTATVHLAHAVKHDPILAHELQIKAEGIVATTKAVAGAQLKAEVED